MEPDEQAAFDFAGFKRAFVTQDVPRWAEFFAENAQWIEYRHSSPPRAPHRLVGRAQIAEYLQGLADSRLTLAMDDEIIGPERAAFCVWVRLPNGRKIIEHVFIYYANGKIYRQVDVEAWD